MRVFVKKMLVLMFILLMLLTLTSCDSIVYDLYATTMFDHIAYNGYDYYLAESIPPYTVFAEEIQVVLVNKNGVPYDEDKKEVAWTYADDPDVVFMNMWGNHYTRDKSLAADFYGFQE